MWKGKDHGLKQTNKGRYRMTTPLQEKCAFCKKNKVTSHHRLCDECWGKRKKEQYRAKRKHLQRPPTKIERKHLKEAWKK